MLNFQTVALAYTYSYNNVYYITIRLYNEERERERKI